MFSVLPHLSSSNKYKTKNNPEERAPQGVWPRMCKRGNCNDSMGILCARVGIEQRPKVVEQRTRLGHQEADFMMVKLTSPPCLLSPNGPHY